MPTRDLRVYLEYIGANSKNKSGVSAKFHQLWVSFGGFLYHRWGKIGTAGQTTIKRFPSQEAAIANLVKIRESKTGIKKRTRYEEKPSPLPFA